LLLLNLTSYHDPWLAAKRDNFFKQIAAGRTHSKKIDMRTAADYTQFLLLT